MVTGEFAFKPILCLLLNGWIIMWFTLWSFLTWYWIMGGSSIGTGRHTLSTCGERQIAVWTYWQRGVYLNLRGKFCMIHAPPFCGNIYIGTPWVLFHPGVVAVNNGPVVLLFVLVPTISSHRVWFVVVGCSVVAFCGLVDCFMCCSSLFSVYLLLYVL